MRTRARREGDEYVINGQKTYISNGQLCNLVIVAASTSPDLRAGGLSLFLVDTRTPGFQRGRRLEKIGLKAQDTSELFLENVRVHADQRLGAENNGIGMLTRNLAVERLAQAIRSICVVETTLEQTVAFASDRQLFGKRLADFENTRFKLAEIATESRVGRVFVDDCMARQVDGTLDATTAAMAKLWASDLHCKAVDECLQLFGAAGYMWEYPVARAYADARATRLAGGSTEVMKHLIGRSLFTQAKTAP